MAKNISDTCIKFIRSYKVDVKRNSRKPPEADSHKTSALKIQCVPNRPLRLHFSRVLKSASFILKTSIYSFYPTRNNMLSLSSRLYSAKATCLKYFVERFLWRIKQKIFETIFLNERIIQCLMFVVFLT